MRKVIRGTVDFFKILIYCVQLLWTTSKKYFLIRIILNIVSLAAPFAVISLTRSLINLLARNSSAASMPGTAMQAFLAVSLLLLGSNIINQASETASTYFAGLHRETMDATMKHLIMEKAAQLDLSFFDSAAFYNEVSDASRNSPLITNSAFQAMNLIRYLVQFIIAFAYLFQFSLILPFVFVASVIPSTVTQIKQVEAIYGFQRQFMSEERKMQYAADVLLSREFAKDVRIYNIFPFISKKFLGIWDILFSKKRAISLRYTKLLLLLSALPEIIAAAFLFLLGLSVIRGAHTIGDYSFLQGIMTQILGSMYAIISSYTQLADGKMRIQNYKKFLGFVSNVRTDGTLELTKPFFKVEFRNVSFRYSENLPFVLKDVNFSFDSRQKIALVGANGSGKTTIIKLLLRFYDPAEGQILLDGIDIREYKPDSVRRRFSTVFQDYSNYAFTVRESVSLSDVSQANDQERIMDSLKQSGADSFTARFPMGLDTYLTRRYDDSGQELSGGQWQKMAIARAFFRKADIYILDEPSASLDAQSEDEVFRMFQAMYAGKGAVLISHRLSNIHLSDLILVLDNGSLAEIGSHGKLMAANGTYAHMYRLQADKYSQAQ
ncbi:MAG: ABC transporter ATP-binding protein [Lachnospiraceae bacterium]|nr:ABC transporter ATP-binding protein [Lachnospiraceae bacterium]